MSGVRVRETLSAPRQRGATGPRYRRRARLLKQLSLAFLVLLTIWGAIYQLSVTLVPSLYYQVPFSGIWPDVVIASAGGLLIVGGRHPERGWRLLGIGCLCWAAGDIYWTVALTNVSNPPDPSWADAGYLGFYPLAFAGILSLVRNHLKLPSRMLIADAGAAALATAAVSAAIVLDTVLAHAHGGPLEVATNLAYPVGDLTMLGLVIGATALDDWRVSRTWVLLGISIIAFWVADSFYLTSVATGTYSEGQAYNGLWYIAPVIAAWAAWLGFERAGDADDRLPARGARVRGIAMLLLVSGAALTILVWSGFQSLGVPAIMLATLTLLVVMVRLVMTWRENVQLLQLSRREALTDMVTGLHNRRALTGDLQPQLRAASDEHPLALVLFDLDGFKHYNDNFGHPAGDALLQRLGRNLVRALGEHGIAYRMGGDEFCAVISGSLVELQGTIERAAAALGEAGDGFTIGCSYGTVVLPEEAQDTSGALRLADQRMYMQKRGGRASAFRQSGDVLLSALQERDPGLRAHLHRVAQLSTEIAHSLGLSAEELEPIRQAAELHDVGKMAIPDAILTKPGPLDEAEWEFIRRHTLIGERIIAAAPALHRVAALVRSCHENFDGSGYPDALAAAKIPLGARIIAVCDAFNAMISDRPYRGAMSEQAAIAELHRCAGSQFDPVVVEHFCICLQLGRLSPAGGHQPGRTPVPSSAHV